MTDLRYKLTDSQRIEIRRLWKSGITNYTRLGLMFGVHAKTIRKVIDDNYRLECNKFNRENWCRHRPSKEYHAKMMREYRHRKNILKKELT